MYGDNCEVCVFKNEYNNKNNELEKFFQLYNNHYIIYIYIVIAWLKMYDFYSPLSFTTFYTLKQTYMNQQYCLTADHEYKTNINISQSNFACVVFTV